MGFGWSPLPFRPGTVCCTLESRETITLKDGLHLNRWAKGDRRSANGAGPLPILAGLGPSQERGFEPLAIRSFRLEVVAGWEVLGVVGVQGVLSRVDELIWRQGTMADEGAAEG